MKSVDINIMGWWFFKKETSKTPFGMTLPGRSYNAHTLRHGFTGHEKESDLAEGIYTTEYRLYDARVARWLSVDPLFEKYVGMSPYNYCMLNPVMMVDPDGRVVCDDDGNIVVDYNPQRVNSLIMQRMNNPNISDGAWMAYNGVLSDDINKPPTIIDGNSGVTYRCGIATTDRGTDFLVLSAISDDVDRKSNCAGISILGGQLGTLSGDEADIVLRDEFKEISVGAMIPNDVVSWGHKVKNDDGTYRTDDNGMPIVATDHLSRYLTPIKFKGDKNITQRFIYKNGYSGSTTWATDNAGSVCSFDNAKNRASGGYASPALDGIVTRCFRPNANRVVPKNIHPLNE